MLKRTGTVPSVGILGSLIEGMSHSPSAMPEGAEDKVLRYEDGEGIPGLAGERGLDRQLLLRDALAELVDRLVGAVTGCHDDAVVLLRTAISGELGADAEQRGEDHALDEAPGVIVDIGIEAGGARDVRSRQPLEQHGRTVRKLELGPGGEQSLLPIGDLAVDLADQLRALRDEEVTPGDAVADVLGHLRLGH